MVDESSSVELLPIHNRKSHSTSRHSSRNPTPGNTPSIPALVPDIDIVSSIDDLSTGGEKQQSSTLPVLDRPQFALLVLLYLLQGIPVGLGFGSIPFLLKSKLTYSQVALFSLASYPYSLKLLWSPVVDALYHPRVGRRKSWIIPIQLISGSTLIFLGSSMDQLLESPEENLTEITWTFFFLVFLCATQDIAVDGWALTILSPEALSYASTAQTIGLNTGYFLSFTVFLALNSPEFSNKYLRTEPLDYGALSLNQYLTFWGVVYIVVTFFVAIFVQEEPRHLKKVRRDDTMTAANTSPWNSLKSVYKSMFQVLKLPTIQSFIVVHLVCKIAFQANEGATNLKLLEKGFGREDLAITVLIDFPFEIVFGYYVAKWSSGKDPLGPWLYAYLGRVLAAAIAQGVVWLFPSSGKINAFYFLLVILQNLFGSFMSTIQFVSVNAFHTKIADPMIGGTYMTTLNTISNLGGQWPRFIVLNMIDWFTRAYCAPSSSSSNLAQFEVTNEQEKESCKEQGGLYTIVQDGYYISNILCMVIGLVLFFGWIRQKVRYLQSLPTSSWRVKEL